MRTSHRLPAWRLFPDCVFSGMPESIGPMWAENQNQNPLNLGAGAASRWSAPSPSQGRDGRNYAPCSLASSAMSSGRLFLDRVARQHCPSPLHRHPETTMHARSAPDKPDISTLQGIGHFYFAFDTAEQG